MKKKGDKKKNREKREAKRIEAEHLVSYSHLDNTKKIDAEGIGKTLNISHGGMLFKSHVPFKEGTEIKVSIAIGEQIIEAEGKVVHVTQKENGLFNVGISFEQSLSLNEKEIENLIKK